MREELEAFVSCIDGCRSQYEDEGAIYEYSAHLCTNQVLSFSALSSGLWRICVLFFGLEKLVE
jgi:hypothetical protein